LTQRRFEAPVTEIAAKFIQEPPADIRAPMREGEPRTTHRLRSA
jgi:hypothetical protein